MLIEGGGRVVKWKHTLYDWLGLRNKPAELAVLAELLLRGRQTEGDLRSRASRMDPIPDLETLQAILKTLVAMDLVMYLTPPEQKRGAVVTHNLYPPAELDLVRQEFARNAPVYEDDPRPRATTVVSAAEPSWRIEVAALRVEVEALKETVHSLSQELQTLKSSLGA